MDTPIRRRRLVVASLAFVVIGAALALALAHGSAAESPSVTSAPAKAAADESVLVVRSAAGHDALWLLSPADGSATAAGVLPGIAGSVAVSPDGLNVAYLTQSGGPRVWIGYGPLAPKTISLTGVGLRRVDSFTWVDGKRLLVAGVRSRTTSVRLDRLYMVNAATGAVRSFRNLFGAEPSLAAAAGKVAYVKFTLLTPGSAPLVRESLKLLSLSGTGAGRTVWREDNRAFAETRALSQPLVSPDAHWFLTEQTGSDVRVTYDVRDRHGYPILTVFTPALQAPAGWDATGQRTAFAGVTDGTGDSTGCVWVYDVVAGSLVRTARGLLPTSMIDSLAWSPSGQLVANAYGVNGATTRHNLVMPGDLSAAKDLGRGRLPVWVTE